jgi:mono/diheme cytochrome c family protein
MTAARKRKRPATPDDDRLTAAVALLGRTGAAEFQVRYCEEEKPVVWIAAARWDDHWESAGAMTPLRAIFRLCDEVIDGGKCQHCHRPTGFSPDLDPLPLAPLVCWYQYDPELKTFRRGCEGDAP